MGLTLWDSEGTWSIERRIDHADGPAARFDGQVGFSRRDGQLIYREEGVLTLDGQGPIKAERSYLWLDDGEGGVAVLFSDGRDFHQIDLTVTAPRDKHWCDPDTYDVEYGFGDWPDWSCR